MPKIKRLLEVVLIIVDYDIKLDFPMPGLLSRLISEAEEVWKVQGDSFEFIDYVEQVESTAKQATLDGKITASQRTRIFHHFGIY